MVTKWAKQELLIEGIDGVDAAATLEGLAGSFDEPRRLQAIARLQALTANTATPAQPKVPDAAVTARAQREAIAAQMGRLDLEQRAASLIERQAVEDLLADACRRLCAVFDQTRAAATGRILLIPADAPNRKALIMAEMRDREAAALAAFTEDCARIGAEASATVTLPETDMEHVA